MSCSILHLLYLVNRSSCHFLFYWLQSGGVYSGYDMSHIVDFHMLPTYYMQECSGLCCSPLSCLSILILHVYWMFWSFPGTWPLAWIRWDVHLDGLHLRRLRLFDLLPVAGCQDGSSGFSLACPSTSMVHRGLTLLRCGVHPGVGG